MSRSSDGRSVVYVSAATSSATESASAISEEDLEAEILAEASTVNSEESALQLASHLSTGRFNLMPWSYQENPGSNSPSGGLYQFTIGPGNASWWVSQDSSNDPTPNPPGYEHNGAFAVNENGIGIYNLVITQAI